MGRVVKNSGKHTAFRPPRVTAKAIAPSVVLEGGVEYVESHRPPVFNGELNKKIAVGTHRDFTRNTLMLNQGSPIFRKVDAELHNQNNGSTFVHVEETPAATGDAHFPKYVAFIFEKVGNGRYVLQHSYRTKNSDGSV